MPADKFEIMGKPVAWKRAGRSGFKSFDTQSKEKAWTAMALESIARQREYTGYPYGRALEVWFVFTMPMPKTWSKKKRERMLGMAHTSRPDKDNLEKFLLDAGKGVLWEDDRLVWWTEGAKVWGTEGKTEMYVSQTMTD